MYAYETDGFGKYNLMDDANIPNLTTLPYIDWCSSFDATYLATRTFALSMDNPFFFSGRYAQGLGSPHTPYGYVWPLGIIGRALTATSSIEVATAITTLAETDGESGLIHESFYPDGYWRYTRPEFGWANALGAELFFRSLAGEPATQFAVNGPILPFRAPLADAHARAVLHAARKRGGNHRNARTAPALDRRRDAPPMIIRTASPTSRIWTEGTIAIHR